MDEKEAFRLKGSIVKTEKETAETIESIRLQQYAGLTIRRTKSNIVKEANEKNLEKWEKLQEKKWAEFQAITKPREFLNIAEDFQLIHEVDTKSGYQGHIYKNLTTGEIILVHEGSISLFVLNKEEREERKKDWVDNDLGIIKGEIPDEMLIDAIKYTNYAIEIAKKNNSELVQTGQSLGGGIAQMIGALKQYHKIKTITFNPIGTRHLSEKLKKDYGMIFHPHAAEPHRDDLRTYKLNPDYKKKKEDIIEENFGKYDEIVRPLTGYAGFKRLLDKENSILKDIKKIKLNLNNEIKEDMKRANKEKEEKRYYKLTGYRNKEEEIKEEQERNEFRELFNASFDTYIMRLAKELKIAAANYTPRWKRY